MEVGTASPAEKTPFKCLKFSWFYSKLPNKTGWLLSCSFYPAAIRKDCGNLGPIFELVLVLPSNYLHSSKDLIIHVPYFLGHVQDHQNENGLIPLETAVSRERRPLNRWKFWTTAGGWERIHGGENDSQDRGQDQEIGHKVIINIYFELSRNSRFF